MSAAPPLIAIVDDEESVRKAIERLLRSAGMEARAFASGEDFLAALPDFRPDCVVLDVHMPGLSGFEVMAQLKGRMPVVVITGHGTPEAEEQAVGAAPRPISASRLMTARCSTPSPQPSPIPRRGRPISHENNPHLPAIHSTQQCHTAAFAASPLPTSAIKSTRRNQKQNNQTNKTRPRPRPRAGAHRRGLLAGRGQETQHPRHLGRQHRLLEHQRLQPGHDGLQDAQH